ncbi:MAG: Rid family hydrolase [Planctomycetota bacterium]|jgi:2-iminobutanoate/2-iminopropanoate deaminase
MKRCEGMPRLGALMLLTVLLAGCVSDDSITRYSDPGALGPYSAAVLDGDYAFLSGKIGPRGGTYEEEVNGAIDAVERTLAQLGLDLLDVVSVTVYLTDMTDYQRFNEIYARRFAGPYPARSCVAVSALPGGARVELAVIARRR